MFRRITQGFSSRAPWCVLVIFAGIGGAADWQQFRGPNGSGVGDATHLPTSFGPEKNVVWKIAVPRGHSSPVIFGDRIFLTGAENPAPTKVASDKFIDRVSKLYTLAIHRETGTVLWRREAPRSRAAQFQTNNTPATPSAAADREGVYVFFQDFGLLAYTNDGAERWRLPLGPFFNINGLGSSPIVYRDLVILICDQDYDSYLLGVDKNTGRVRYKVPRPDFTRSYSTPAIYPGKNGQAELIVPGSYRVTSYYAATGEKAWWASGLSWQPKTVPVFDGDMIYTLAADVGGDSEVHRDLPTYAELVAQWDANHDGKVSVEELRANPKYKNNADQLDLDANSFIDERDWKFFRERNDVRNTLLAVRYGGRGDLTQTNVVWSMKKFLPNCTSPLIYRGVMYVVKEGGILTALDPRTGEILKQGRLTGALDLYYASPVAAAGKVFLVSQQGKATVIKAGAGWEILAVNDLQEDTVATPAIADNRIYFRTSTTLFCFGEKE
jgi:outer membrane protein assembly factor BamB